MLDRLLNKGYVKYLDSQLEIIFSYLCSRYKEFTTICFLFMVTILFLSTPFNEPLREDAYRYLLKGFEITQGDWTPVHTHFIGWSIPIAFFLKIFGIKSIFKGMILSRILSIFLICFSIFPFSGLANKLVAKKAAITAVMAFALSPIMIQAGISAYNEPLFILLVISTIYYLANSTKPTNVVVATVLASLSYYVKPNGIFLLVVIVLSLIFPLKQRRRNWLFLLLVVPFLFLLVSQPHLQARYEAFGSAFNYGENSKYFVDSYQQVWSSNIPTPSIFDYLATHSIGDYFRKFIIEGLLKVLTTFSTILGKYWFILFSLGTVKYLILDRSQKSNILFILFFVFLVGFTPVFEVFGAARHLIVLLPFAFIISSKFLLDLLGESKGNNILIFSFMLLLFLNPQIPISIIDNGINMTTPKIQDEWAIWAANNLQGKIAIIEGADLIQMNLSDQPRVGGNKANDSSAEQSSRSYHRPSNYNNLEEAMQDFEKMKFKYLLLDSVNIVRKPYLKEVYNAEWSENFILIKSFKSKPTARWFIRDMDIFKIIY